MAISVKFLEICEILFENKDEHCLLNVLVTRYNLTKHPNFDYNELSDQISKFYVQFLKKWKSSLRSKANFLNRNKDWLTKDFSLINANNISESEDEDNIQATSSSAGRPSKQFSDLSERTKRRKVIEKSSAIEMEEASKVLAQVYKKEKLKDHAKIVNKMAKASPKRIDRVVNSFPTPSEVKNFSNEEALALCLDLNLTVNKYKLLRKRLQEKNINVLPSYEQLSKTKQESIPLPLQITDVSASVNLQDLLDHTAKRIIMSMKLDESNLACKDFILYSKWGCDGSSGQSVYKQQIASDKSDANLFMVSLVPLRLKTQQLLQVEEPSTSSRSLQEEIWKNPRPSSTRFCRPIKFEYIKETKEATISMVNSIKDEIKNLRPTLLPTMGDKTLSIFHKLSFTMVDGKVVQTLTKTASSSSCTVCNAKQSQLNDSERAEIEDNLEFGISPLHARIRFMEHVLKIAYDLSFKGDIRGNAENSKRRSEEKTRIQTEFKRETGMIIDTPKQGFGNTNDGNTARRFFADAVLTAEITKVDYELIRRFKVILNALSSTREIDPDKFHKYASDTADIYLKNYGSWRTMSSTVHKVLRHGSAIIRHHILPLGELSEEAQESRNKDYRKFRLSNTRKNSRINQNNDLFSMLLVSSDPAISSLRMIEKKQSYEEEDADFLQLLENRAENLRADIVRL